MGVRGHRIAAASLFTVGVVAVVLATRARIRAEEPEPARSLIARLQGDWVAERVQSGESCRLEGPAAETCRAEIRGKSVAFRRLVDADEARGTLYLDATHQPAWVDLKLDAGWITGVVEAEGDEMTLCVNALAPLEILGIPSRPRPRSFAAGERRHVYVFRRVADSR